MIPLGEATAPAAARRLALGVDKWLVLQRAADRIGLRLPADLRLELDPVAAALSVADPDRALAEAETLLRERRVLDDDGAPVPAVAANLAAIGSAARRARVTVAGPGISRLGYYWVDTDLGGSVVRDDATHTLSLFDARTFGSELLRQVPGGEGGPGRREPLIAPLDLVGPVGMVDDAPPAGVLGALGDLVGEQAEVVSRLREWRGGNRAVLHVTVVGRGRPPHALVWFLDRDGWWAARVTHHAGRRRMLELEPRRRDDLAAALGDLVAGAWT